MTPAALAAAAREQDEDRGEPICVMCGDSYTLRDGGEVTAYCDPCAQEVAAEVDEMRAKLSAAEADLQIVRAWGEARGVYDEAPTGECDRAWDSVVSTRAAAEALADRLAGSENPRRF